MSSIYGQHVCEVNLKGPHKIPPPASDYYGRFNVSVELRLRFSSDILSAILFMNLLYYPSTRSEHIYLHVSKLLVCNIQCMGSLRI